MRVLRRLGRLTGSAVLWVLVVVGAVSAGLWALNRAGLVQPLVVVSGSMQPSIRTGDLLFATATPVEEVSVGEVTTIRSRLTGKLVTHRVVARAASADSVRIRMQGDDNAVPDSEEYQLSAGDQVWQPVLTVPGGGYVVASLMRPAVAVPLILGVLALCGLGLFPARRDDSAEPPAEAVDPDDLLPLSDLVSTDPGRP